MKGTGGTDPGGVGVQILDAAVIKTNGGALTITGTGGDWGNDSYGIYTSSATLDTSNVNGTAGGNITLNGTGGSNRVRLTRATMASFWTKARPSGLAAGILRLPASAGTAAKAWEFMSTPPIWTPRATEAGIGGTITLDGTGGIGIDYNSGVYLDSTTITTGGGAINVTGTGGGDTTGYDNYGIYSYSTTLDTSGSGATGGIVALTGTGGNGMGSNIGVYLGNTTTTAGGDVTLTGFGGGVDGGAGNHGVVLDSSSIFSSGNVTALG